MTDKASSGKFGTLGFLKVLFGWVLCGSLLFGQEPQDSKTLAPHKPISRKVSHTYPLPAAVPGSVFGGPWMTDGDFKSTVHIKNGVETSGVTVTPILYLSNGAAYTLPNIQLEPAGTAVMNIGSSLQKLGIAPYAKLSGYVELKYNWPWDPLCATIRNVDTTHSVIFSYGLRSSKPPRLPGENILTENLKTNVVEGLWWKQEASVTGFMALVNTSSRILNVSIEISDSIGAVFSQHTARISPHATKMLDLIKYLQQVAPMAE